MTTDATSARDVVNAFHAALLRRDYEAARASLADDLRFQGPIDSFETADQYLEAIRRLWGIVDTIEVRHVSSDGDEVVVLYDMVTTTPAGIQLVCEWFGVEDARIAWLRAVFDTAPFASLRR